MQDNEYDYIKEYVKESVGDEETQALISDFAILWNQYEDELYYNNKIFEGKHERQKGHHIRYILPMINHLRIDDYIDEIKDLYYGFKNYITSRNENSFETLVKGFHIIIREPDIDENGNVITYSNGDIKYVGEIKKEDLIRIMNSNYYVDQLHFILLITARVRNNMFHGKKGIYDLRNQKDLFKLCNKTLKLVLDIYEKERYL